MESTRSIFFTRYFLWGALAFALLLGLGIRLYDLTDPPFDFHPTRQWRSALIARGMYYENLDTVPDWQRERAVAQWHNEAVIEPLVVETLVVWGYRLTGGAHLWVARLLSSVFWVLGGLAIFLLGRELACADGGIVAAIYYLFLPYGMIASRAFQPDPLMVALITAGLWASVRWHNRRTMGAAVLAGVFAGLAIFVKTVAVYVLGGALAGLVLAGKGEDRQKSKSTNQQYAIRFTLYAIRDPQTWVIAALTILPTAAYYIYGLFINDFLRQQFKFRFFPELLRDPAFYIRWVEMSSDIVGYGALLAALVGIFLLRDKAIRAMGIGIWIGYAAYSVTFPFHAITHDYYQLPLIPIVAISLIPVGALILGQLASLEKGGFARLVVAGIILFGVAFKVWDTRVILARKDYRGDAEEWARFGEIIPPNASVVAITHAYGYPLAYYGWVNAAIWLSGSDAELRELGGVAGVNIENKRLASFEGKDLFLVTRFKELDNQPELKEMLYSDYEIFAEGEGFVIFDLNRPLQSPP
ncbi:MAG: glycosyltransferase family 39 protein [Anaerolineales bacterium]